MGISFKCPHCNGEIKTATDFTKDRIQCPLCAEIVLVPAQGLEPGTRLAGYQIEKRLGGGGMGEVFLATQLAMNRKVALKVFCPGVTADKSLTKRFMHEIQMAGKLEHPNIVTSFDAGVADEYHYLAMSYVEGEDLDYRLDSGPLSETEGLGICVKVVNALNYGWKKFQMLHRDIKPANIMIDSTGEVKLMDMGIAKSLTEDSGLTMRGSLIGTPYYMSPEQAIGVDELDCRADIYSLGATLYHLVTGKRPFRGENAMAVVAAALNEPLISPKTHLPALSPACNDLICRMMEKKPENRPADWDTLAKQLRTVLNRSARHAGLAVAVGSGFGPEFVRRKQLVNASLIAAVLLMIGGLAAFSMTLANSSAEPRHAGATSQTDGEPRHGVANGGDLSPTSSKDTAARQQCTELLAVLQGLVTRSAGAETDWRQALTLWNSFTQSRLQLAAILKNSAACKTEFQRPLNQASDRMQATLLKAGSRYVEKLSNETNELLGKPKLTAISRKLITDNLAQFAGFLEKYKPVSEFSHKSLEEWRQRKHLLSRKFDMKKDRLAKRAQIAARVEAERQECKNLLLALDGIVTKTAGLKTAWKEALGFLELFKQNKAKLEAQLQKFRRRRFEFQQPLNKAYDQMQAILLRIGNQYVEKLSAETNQLLLDPEYGFQTGKAIKDKLAGFAEFLEGYKVVAEFSAKSVQEWRLAAKLLRKRFEVKDRDFQKHAKAIAGRQAARKQGKDLLLALKDCVTKATVLNTNWKQALVLWNSFNQKKAELDAIIKTFRHKFPQRGREFQLPLKREYDKMQAVMLNIGSQYVDKLNENINQLLGDPEYSLQSSETIKKNLAEFDQYVDKYKVVTEFSAKSMEEWCLAIKLLRKRWDLREREFQKEAKVITRIQAETKELATLEHEWRNKGVISIAKIVQLQDRLKQIRNVKPDSPAARQMAAVAKQLNALHQQQKLATALQAERQNITGVEIPKLFRSKEQKEKFLAEAEQFAANLRRGRNKIGVTAFTKNELKQIERFRNAIEKVATEDPWVRHRRAAGEHLRRAIELQTKGRPVARSLQDALGELKLAFTHGLLDKKPKTTLLSLIPENTSAAATRQLIGALINRHIVLDQFAYHQPDTLALVKARDQFWFRCFPNQITVLINPEGKGGGRRQAISMPFVLAPPGKHGKFEVQTPFYMGSFEVSIGEYRRFSTLILGKAIFDDANKPVRAITYVQAVRYCNWLSAQSGVARPGYKCSAAAAEKSTIDDWQRNDGSAGFALPTEAQWQLACFYTDKAGKLTDTAAYKEHAAAGTAYNRDDIKRLAAKPNFLGLYFMRGNLGELISDLAGKLQKREIVMGRDYRTPASIAAKYYRQEIYPDDDRTAVGFRIILPINQ